MLLEKLAEPRAYIYAERYINQFKRVANEVSPQYCAMQGSLLFSLPYVDLPKSEVLVFLANPTIEVIQKIVSDGRVRLYAHPETVEELTASYFGVAINDGPLVQPIASTRTVLPEGEDYFLKLHLNRRLSKYIRRLTPSSVEHSVLISSELETSLGVAPLSFGYFPESIGVAYREIGMLVREAAPRPFSQESRIQVPLFSLYSRDTKRPDDEPFFVQLVDRQGVDPLDFLIEGIINPLFVNMSWAIQNHGLLLEPHGQNVVVEMGPDFDIARLLHRDFQSMYVDTAIRQRNGLSQPFSKHLMGVECSKELSYGLVYDQFVGEYVLDNFVNLLHEVWGVEPNKTREAIIDVFRTNFDLTLFPDHHYYLLKKGLFNDNDSEFVRYDKKPKYRP